MEIQSNEEQTKRPTGENARLNRRRSNRLGSQGQWIRLWTAGCGLLIVAFAHSTSAAPVSLLTPHGEEATAPGKLLMKDLQGKALGNCPLQHTEVTADVSGFVARVNVEQQFHNPSTTPIEAVYTFPLPHDCAVDDMTMVIGTRTIRGEIKRREQARQIYEAAKSQGRATALLDQERPNIFTQSVANVMPGQDIKIRISYVNLLKYDEGVYEFVFPMLVGPRYVGPGVNPSPETAQGAAPAEALSQTSGVTDADNISPPIADPTTHAGHDLSLTINLDAGVPIQELTSVLHKIDVTRSGPNQATIRLSDGSTIPNKDFILRFRVAGKIMHTGLLAHADAEGSGTFSLILQPPQIPPQGEVSAKEMVFVIDQTGSQAGWPIAKAKETMKYCIKHLNRGDTFQLIGFNTELYPCFPKPVHATSANIQKALAFLEPIDGDGGTDILKSVQYALKIPDDPVRPRIICYMTDGYVGNDMAIIDCIQKNRGRARMFPFGIGNAVNRFLIEGMAKEGRGASDYVTLQESGEEAAAKFYQRIAQPLLLDIHVDWNGLPVDDVLPKYIPDVFTSGPIILKGRYTQAAEGDITIHGILRGKPWAETVHVKLPAVEPANSALSSVWAREKIEDLQSQDWMGAQSGKPDPKIKEQIVDTALGYHLMSQYTSFVAVEETVTNNTGELNSTRVPVELPEGVSPQAVAGSAAVQVQGTPAPVTTNTPAIGGGGGDPYIAVHAPPGTLRVAAIFPTGEPKDLTFNSQAGVWDGRFDFPFGTPAGEYHVTIIVVSRDGARLQYHLVYQNLLSSSAAGSATTLTARPGEPITVSVAGTGISRAVALAPWGDRSTLESQNGAWKGQFIIPTDWKTGNYLITVVLLDGAHNRTEISIDLDVKG